MSKCPDIIKRLIDRFTQQSDQIRSPDYNETLIRIDFINPLMNELGWDIDNSQGFAERYREVVHEDRVRVAGQTKAPDYSFRIGGQRKFFLEAKKPAVDIRNNWEPAYQLRRYGWTAKLPCSLLTDFEELAIYDTRIQPRQLEKASVARRDYIRYTDYPDRWDFICGTFSKDAVLKGEFDRYCESKKGRGAHPFDDAFLAEIEEWRKSIASSLARHNDDLDEPALNFAVQRIIDRIIFLRIAEDRGTEQAGQLKDLLAAKDIYRNLVTLFNRADERYNSGLFHFHKEKDRNEAPDTLTPKLDVDDRTLKGIIKALYYPESPYEFTMVSADILGSVYERFLGKVITLTPGHRAKIEEKPEVRKAGGVYYTPTYIVDYIVRNTVGTFLEGKTPKEASKLTILDPACGSGSFLIGAYQFLLDWYLDQYTRSEPAALATGKKAVLRPGLAGDWALTIAERKRILLDHIHGVDIDGQAVEVTKLNLLLKCLEGETSQTLGFEQRLFRERALPDLGKNIVCGNSLIGTDIIGTDAWEAMSEDERRHVNPFEYKRAFPGVFKQSAGGFDVVIGNPPYVRVHRLDAFEKEALWERYQTFVAKSDLYACFVEQSIRQLADGGRLGFITPNTWTSLESFTDLRTFVLDNTIIERVARTPHKVFADATVRTFVFVLMRAKSMAARERSVTAVDQLAPTSVESNISSVRSSEMRSAHLANLQLERQGGGAAIIQKASVYPQIKSLIEFAYGFKTADDEQFLDSECRGRTWEPFARSADIRRYGQCVTTGFVDYRPAVMRANRATARPGDRRRFERPKIVIARMGRKLVATVDLEGTFIKDAMLLHDRSDEIATLKAVTGCLNSGLLQFIYSNSFITIDVLKNALLALPLPPDYANRCLVSLVDTMLSLHKRLAAEQLPQRRKQIQREIDATDRQIDKLVFQLYGLTDDEIAIVEAATA